MTSTRFVLEIRKDVVTDVAQHRDGRDDIFSVFSGDADLLVRLCADGEIDRVKLSVQLCQGDVFSDTVSVCTSTPVERMTSISASSRSRGRR